MFSFSNFSFVFALRRLDIRLRGAQTLSTEICSVQQSPRSEEYGTLSRVLPTNGGGRILPERGCSASALKGLLNLVLLNRIAGIRSKHVHSVPSLARPMPFGRLRRSFVGSALGVKCYQPTNQPTNLFIPFPPLPLSASLPSPTNMRETWYISIYI